MNALQPLQCFVPRGIRGTVLVHGGERKERGVCQLHLTRAASATFGVTSVLQKSVQVAQAINAFGCALSHRAALMAAARSRDPPSDFVWVFEDDAYCAVEPDIIIETLERLLRAASESGHTVDLVYCGQTGAESTGDVLACNGGCAPRQCCCGGHRLVRTKHAYGSFSYLLRRSKIETVCQFLDPRAIVYTSDGALNKSVAKGFSGGALRGGRRAVQSHRAPATQRDGWFSHPAVLKGPTQRLLRTTGRPSASSQSEAVLRLLCSQWWFV